MKKLLLALFALLIGFAVNAQTITVLSPGADPGEDYMRDSVIDIVVQRSGFTGQITLQYSTTGVAGTYTNIATVNSSSTTVYSWTVPAVSSTDCYVRAVRTTGLPAASGTSPNNFRIRDPQITVDAPNGGEVWGQGTSQYISWIQSDNDYVDISYTTNGGTSWSSVATGVTASNASYNWTVPSTLSTNCKVAITNSSFHQFSDTSDAVFTINGPTVTVLTPNGGEMLTGNQSYDITWTSTGLSAYVNLYYSTDAGSTWNYIDNASNSNGGTYSWTVANVNTTNALIKIEDYYTPTYVDQSNSTFEINGVLPSCPTTMAPLNGAASVNVNTSLTWDYMSNATSYDVYFGTSSTPAFVANTTNNYYTPATLNVATVYYWKVISKNSFGDAVGCSTYSFNTTGSTTDFLMNNTNVTSCVGNFYDSGGPSGTYNNNENFTKTFYPGTPGQYVQLNFSSFYSESGYDHLKIYDDTIATGTPIADYTGSITPGILTASNSSGALTAVFTSDVSVTPNGWAATISCVLTPPTGALTVTYPNGGENLNAGSAYNISWTSTNVSSVKIEYSTNGGTAWNTITSATTNTGSYSWTVPSLLNTCNARIRVSNSNDASVVDSSNANFCIVQPSLTFTSPLGGESYVGGSAFTSTYNYTGALSYINAYYSLDSINWTLITNYAVTGYFNWTPPSNIDTCTVYLKIADYYNANTYTISNAFCVTAPAPSITLNSLNGGQNIVAGSSQYVYWTGINTSNYYDLYYSVDNGTNWIFVDDHIGNTNYYWTVPNVTSCNVLFKVQDNANAALADSSSSTFCINIPTFTLTSPNGGESWTAGTTQAITWTSSNASNYVNLDYSINNGSSWTTITTPYNYAGSNSYNWSVPNAPSCSTLVRVVDYYSNTYGDTSNADFCINGPQPALALTSPNGGQNWVIGSSYYIQWTSTSVSNVKLEYSSTGAAGPYTVITGSTSAAATYYYWNTTGLTAGCNYYIRVSDATNASLNDVSNNSFCLVQPTITVTTPNGGEAYVAGTTQNITWTSANTSGYVDVYYSTNGGNTWTGIYSGYNNGSYAWSVPFNSSCNYTIKVDDYYSTATYDVSNAAFCVALPTPAITVNYPNGGEAFVTNTSTNITWNSVSVSAVNIDYTTNNGASWTNLVTNYTTNNNYYNGSYFWNLSGAVTSSNYRVKVTATANATVKDSSNNTFSVIPPYVTVNAPNGGEVWGMGSYHYIYWNAPGVSLVNIEYSTNGGVSFTTIATNVTASNNYYNWLIPSTTASTQCLVRVKDASNPTTIYDISNNYFTIPAPSIALTAPNGGQSYGIGTGQYIYWTSTSVVNVNITYSVDSGATWANVATGVAASNGYYYWTVPNTPSNDVLVKVADASNVSLNDSSNAVFTIITPVITLTAPNGAESWMATTAHAITWNSYGLSSYVNLQYSTNGGSSWTAIVNGAYNSGSYNWSVPNTPSTNCLVRIIDYSYNTYGDTSNAVFTIVAPTPFLTLTTPNGGQTWGVGSYQNITWNSNISSVNLYYSTDNGTTWNAIASGVSAANASYSWMIPNTPSPACLVKIENAANTSLYDVSNATFAIPAPAITLTSPNGGENWGAGSTQYIYWNATSVPTVKVEYSTNNGVLWNTLVNSTNGYSGYYAWNVPSVSSNQCKVRVSSTTNAVVNDVSNAAFSISIPTITLVYPNGGEQLIGLTYKQISWTSVATSNYVNVQYSTDGGTSWMNVANGIYNTGSYNWYIPNTSTTQGRIRVSDYYNGSVLDNSNANFTVNQATPSLAVSYPNGGENFLVGNSYSIYWSATSVQNVKIEYTTDNGVNWSLISASTPASNGSYYWSVPNLVSNLCRVRVTDVSNNTLTDASNNVFSISQPIPALSLTSPNGGENWTIGGYSYITWSANNINGVNIFLSRDSGATWTNLANNATGSYYYYNVVGPVSSACYVKLVASNIASLIDSSAADFNIDSAIVNNNTVSIDTLTRLGYCKGDTLSVPFTSSGVFNPGNVYEVQLSDSSGSFAYPIPIGNLTSVLDSGNIACTIPTNIINGIHYIVRVVASNLTATGTAYTMPIVINSPEFDFTPSTQLRKYLPDGVVNFAYVGDTTGVVNYRWEFGNGDTAVTRNATHNYDQIGFYTVVMTATTNAGCSSTVTKYDLVDVEQIFPSIDLGNIGSGNQLNGVAASSQNGDTLYAVGNNGIIISSTDGGVTWYSIPGVPTSNYTGVTLAGGGAQTYICVSGTSGYLAFSSNGGQTWNQVSNASTGSADYHDVHFSSYNNGFGVGASGSVVYYDGNTWTNQSALVNNSSATFNAVATSSSTNAMVVGNGGVAYIYNGTTWSSVATNVTTDLHAVYYVSGTTWLASGDNGLIIKSTDNGLTWTTEFSGISSSFTSIAVDPINSTVWAVGGDGVVYQQLAGQTFERYSIGTTSNQRGASYKSGKGVIVGDSGVGYRFGATDVAVGDLGTTTFCAGAAITIPLQVSGSFNLGNVFTAQLSDATGDFTTPTVLGSIATNIEANIVTTIPSSVANGTSYRIRIVSTDTALVGNDNGVDLTINAAPSVDLGSDLAPCTNDTIYLDALNAGSTFAWSNDSLTQSIMVTASGTYTVTVTNAALCSTSDSVAVSYINSQFNIDLGSDIASCNASGVTLDAGVSGLVYTWSTTESTQSIQVTTSGQYIVSASKCSFSDADTITVNIGAPTVFSLGNDALICGGSSLVLHAPITVGNTYSWSNASTADSLVATASGTYSVVVTNASGCVSSDTLVLSIGVNPVVSLGNDTSVCGSLVLTAPTGAGYTYLWTPGNITTQTITVSTAGAHTETLTVTNTSGCSTTDVITVTILSGAASAPVITQVSNTMTCSTSGATYQWYYAGVAITGATAQTYTTTIAGIYSVVTNGGVGCNSTSADYLFNPDGVVSINANGTALSIAPNPTNGKFMLSFDLKSNQNVTVKVSDVLGREVYAENMNSFVGKYNKAIDLANFANGVYTVNVIMNESNFVEKVVLQK